MARANSSWMPSASFGSKSDNSRTHHTARSTKEPSMAAKQIAYDVDARERMLKGVQKLSKAVKVTLGPSGRVVILEKSFGAPTVTKDGVTVAKEIELDDPYENLGAQMIKEVAQKASKDAGDGTTTATIYAEAIYAERSEERRVGKKCERRQ